jgi:hypothetical protein
MRANEYTVLEETEALPAGWELFSDGTESLSKSSEFFLVASNGCTE